MWADQCTVNFVPTGDSRFSFWAELDEVFKKEVSVVSCHQTKTELPQRAQDGRKRREEGQQLSEHFNESRRSCGRERLGRKDEEKQEGGLAK